MLRPQREVPPMGHPPSQAALVLVTTSVRSCCRQMRAGLEDGTDCSWTQARNRQRREAGLRPVQQRRAFWSTEATRPAMRGSATYTCWICTRTSDPRLRAKDHGRGPMLVRGQQSIT